jgi:hypothetical protein
MRGRLSVGSSKGGTKDWELKDSDEPRDRRRHPDTPALGLSLRT